jgi:S1-C subfamily serine protease
MTGPKHLWSGDWQRESAGSAEDLLTQAPADPPPPDSTDPAEPPGGTGRGRRRPTQRQQAAVAAVVIVAAIAVALASALGGNSKQASPRTTAQSTLPFRIAPVPNQILPTPTSPTPTTPTPTIPGQASSTQPTPSPISNQPALAWLGMQIVNSPSGEVVATVRAGSAGETAGFEPGDVLNSVNGRPVGAPKEILAALANVKLGHQVQIEIDRGSTVITVPVSLTARPTIQP